MFGRLIYVMIIAGVLLAGGFAFDFLANEPGTITIDYNETIYEFSMFKAAVILVIGILAVMLIVWALKFIFALLRFIFGDENAFGGLFARRRERRGLDALSRSLHAMASGDAKTARRKAEIAERKLENTALTRLVNAQAAEMTGDDARAAAYYKALMSEEETAFVGTKGLLQQAINAEEHDRALKLASHAQSLKPKDADTLATLFSLQSRNFDWESARKTLAIQAKAGHLPKLEVARRDAALILAQSNDARDIGELEHARALAVDAAKADARNVEAVGAAVGLLVDAGSKRAASKLVMDSWRHGPDARLAAAYADIEPDESPAQRRRRFEGLFSLHPEHDETRFMRAELALVDDDWKEARTAIEDLREIEPSARSCAIMAAVARGEGEPEHVVRGWLARALGAPRDAETDRQISHVAMLPLLVEPNPEPPDAAMSGEDAATESAAPEDTGSEAEDPPAEEAVVEEQPSAEQEVVESAESEAADAAAVEPEGAEQEPAREEKQRGADPVA